MKFCDIVSMYDPHLLTYICMRTYFMQHSTKGCDAVASSSKDKHPVVIKGTTATIDVYGEDQVTSCLATDRLFVYIYFV